MDTRMLWLAGLLLVISQPVPSADRIPEAAGQYRRTLMRCAHAEWGLDAPLATLAAQVHQESRWQADAQSPVGASGLAQFMPATAAWMASLYPQALGEAQPLNPGWALRAMVAYDRDLYRRNPAQSACHQWAFALSAYNGGQGWVNRDRRLAVRSGADGQQWWDAVERYNAGRSQAAFAENRGYPKIILRRWEPLYISAGWGDGVCP